MDMMTKDQAMEKICPLLNRLCIVNECAMWRWMPAFGVENGAQEYVCAQNANAESEHEAGSKPERCKGWEFCPCDVDNPAGWLEPEETAQKRRKGYCGLAGKPMV